MKPTTKSNKTVSLAAEGGGGQTIRFIIIKSFVSKYIAVCGSTDYGTVDFGVAKARSEYCNHPLYKRYITAHNHR